MADKFDTASIGRQISANEAGTFGSEVKRHLVTANLRIVLHIAKNAASLGTDNTVGLIEAENAVHSRGADDDLVVNGHRSTDKASATTLRDDSQLALVAVAENCADIGSVGWLDHDGGVSFVLFGPVCVMNLKLLFISNNSFIAEHAFKVLDVLSKIKIESQ